MTHSLLDNDFYALTMAQLIWKHYPDQMATYAFINRDKSPLTDYLTVEEVEDVLQPIQKAVLSPVEKQFLQQQGLFESEFLDQLSRMHLPPVQVEIGENGLAVKAEGVWWQTIWWETPALAAITSAYQHRRLARAGIAIDDAYRIGLEKLDAKIELLRQHPEIRFSEFGARRRFDLPWQETVVRRLQEQLPDQLAGTSNMWLARQCGLPMIGTMAHQLFMGAAALAVERGESEAIGLSQQQILEQWETMYGAASHDKLLVFLTDTYSTSLALRYFPKAMAERWRGMRQDSGDPIAYGEELLRWYIEQGIDPRQHFMLCSDGLDIPRAIEIAEHFAGRLPVQFGIGTNLVNDLVFAAPSLVWKLVGIDGQSVVKLSDDPEKHSGPVEDIGHYEQMVDQEGIVAAA